MANDQHGRPIREIPNDTTKDELEAGHLIPGANPPRNEDARGGFGNRDGKEGYGTDSENGISAVSVNEAADRTGHPADNMRSIDEGRPTKGENEDVALSLDELEPYSDAAEQQAISKSRLLGPTNRSYASDTGPSGEADESLLTEDGNNVRRDVRISGQEMTLDELAARGTNADLTDPDANAGGIAHAG